jgi:hypothetical protein
MKMRFPWLCFSAAAVIGLLLPTSASAQNAEIAGVVRATLQLIAPGTLYDKRLNQVDTKLAKTFRVRGARIQSTVSVFNLFNANTPPREVRSAGGFLTEVISGVCSSRSHEVAKATSI